MRRTPQHKVDKEINRGAIQSGILNMGATSSCRKEDGLFIATGNKSNKVFQMPTGYITIATEVKLLQHNVREPAWQIDIVPAITTDALISMAKFADADYMAVFDKEKVEIFDANNTKVLVTCGAILRGWRCKDTGLWRTLLTKEVKDNNTDMVLSTELPMTWLQGQPQGEDTIQNVYELNMQLEII